MAIALILSTLVWSIFPLATKLSDAGKIPFAFYTLYGVSTSISLAIYLRYYHKISWKRRIQALNKEVLLQISQQNEAPHQNWWDRYAFVLAVIGRFGIGIYAWSTNEIDPAVAAIIIESWVLWFVIIRRIGDKSLKLGFQQTTSLFVMSFFGLIFVNMSENGTFSKIWNWGLILALMAAILEAISIDRSLKFAKKANKENVDKKTELSDAILVLFVSNIFVTFASTVALLVFNITSRGGLFNFPEISSSRIAVIFVFGIIAPASMILVRYGNIHATSLEINSIQYAAPVTSVIILIVGTELFSRTGWFPWATINLERGDMLIIGAVIIIIVNLIFHFQTGGQNQAEGENFGYKILLIGIWLTGVAVYFRDRVLEKSLDFNLSWLWKSGTDYFALLALSATIFILILSFRKLSLNERTWKEEEIAFGLYWKIRQICSKAIAENVKAIDRSNDFKQITNSKFKILQAIQLAQITPTEKAEAKSELSQLSRSRMQGRDTTDIVILIGFAFTTIFISLLTRPGFIGWTGFIIDVFSIIFSATIAYMALYHIEQRNRRNRTIFDDQSFDHLETHLPNYEMREFVGTQHEEDNSSKHESQFAKLILPITLCCVMLGIFIFLLYIKWHGGIYWHIEVCPSIDLTLHSEDTSNLVCNPTNNAT